MDERRLDRDLTEHEVRVLGCLIEKEATTPDAYPLTVNSLRNACNQSTSRNPVMSLTDHDVESALASLRERGLTRTVYSTSNRATKYRHVLPEALGLDAAATALIAVLMLRGEQTVGELKARTERQHAFGSTDEVTEALESLASPDRALVRQLERRPGQKDARWVQVLGAAAASSDVLARTDGSSGAADPSDVFVRTDGSSGAVDPSDVFVRTDGSSGAGDPYGGAMAEFSDLLAVGDREAFGLGLIDLLSDVDPSVGPIIDLGSGTGVGLAAIALAVPGATIHAVEPSSAMRTALHTRLMMDRELRPITTVDPRPWSSALLPERAGAIVASAVLGHLDDGERERLWRCIAEHLPVGAPAVIELLPPHRPIEVPETTFGSIDVGEYTYSGRRAGEPTDEHHLRWRFTFEVQRGAERIAEYTVTCRWRCLGVDDIRAEAARHGLTTTRHGDVVVVRRTV